MFISYLSQLIVKVIVGPGRFLLSVFGGFQFVDPRPEIGRVSSECDVQMLQNTKIVKQQLIL